MKIKPLAHGESSGLKLIKQLPIYIRSLTALAAMLHQDTPKASGFSLQLSFLEKKARSPCFDYSYPKSYMSLMQYSIALTSPSTTV